MAASVLPLLWVGWTLAVFPRPDQPLMSRQDGLARFREGEPSGEPISKAARTSAAADRPPTITKFHSGSLVRVTHDGLEKYRPSWARDGHRLLFARREADGSHIWQYVLDSRNTNAPSRRLTDRKEPEYHGVFSPDGAHILFTAITLSGTQGNFDIAVINADGTGLKIVVNDAGKLVHQDWPSWSPDGRRFAFSSTHDGNQEIYTAAIEGTSLVRLTQHSGIDSHPCWSPGGRTIAFATDRWGGLELAAVKPDGTGVMRLTKSPGLDDYPAYSPDGSRIAFVSNRDGQFEVYICGADGSDAVNLSRHPLRDTFPTWRPDGRGVTFVSNREGGFELYTQMLGPNAGSTEYGDPERRSSPKLP